jgi:hypothetical protein
MEAGVVGAHERRVGASWYPSLSDVAMTFIRQRFQWSMRFVTVGQPAYFGAGRARRSIT